MCTHLWIRGKKNVRKSKKKKKIETNEAKYMKLIYENSEKLCCIMTVMQSYR